MKLMKHQEKTSAGKTSIGFDYQFLYFVYQALELKTKQKIGYEVKDDVHLELDNGREIYIQLKHSLQENVDDSIINMTEKDLDLWKSIYNWNVIINELDEPKRIPFIIKSDFVLVTNKNNNNNPFFKIVEEIQQNKISIIDFKKYLVKLVSSIKSDKEHSATLKRYINLVLNQNDKVLLNFIQHITFTLDFDNLIEKIQDQIISKHVDARKVDEIFEKCIGNLSIWKYQTIKKGEHVIITFEEIDKRLKHCFEYGRSNKFPRTIKELKFPTELVKQNFIKELIEIFDINECQKSKITQYTTYRLKIENLLNIWIQEDYITESQKEDFLSECIAIWINYHNSAHRGSRKILLQYGVTDEYKNDKINDNSLHCLDEIRKISLSLCEEKLNVEECNGVFYSLSEQSQIGWKLDWERNYDK